MNFSNEQLLVINSDKQHITVNAGPGTGKTTLLLGIVENRIKENHLILCFNASIKEEITAKLQKKNITNAKCFTFHGLAHSFFMKHPEYINKFYRRNFEENLDFFSMNTILQNLKIIDSYEDSLLPMILDAFQKYLKSDKKIENMGFSEDMVKYCKQVMSYIINNDQSLMFHEVYIKFYQLLNPKTSFDSILIDEYQDVSECYLSIINSLSKNKRSVRVGDTYQKIYGYNGALGMEGCDFKLTQSFRVGPENSVICNVILNKFFENAIELNGVRQNTTIGSINQSYTKIFRSNSSLVRELVHLVKSRKRIKVSSATLDLIKTFEYLFKINKFGKYSYKGIPVKDDFFLRVLYFTTRDRTLKKYFEFYTSFTDEELKEFFCTYKEFVFPETEEKFDVHLITAHRCKGLEFSAVKLADDFIELEKIEELFKKETSLLDEVYVLFVALTRSNGVLELNENLKKLIESEEFGGLL